METEAERPLMETEAEAPPTIAKVYHLTHAK
jgi:hypothetical protein